MCECVTSSIFAHRTHIHETDSVQALQIEVDTNLAPQALHHSLLCIFLLIAVGLLVLLEIFLQSFAGYGGYISTIMSKVIITLENNSINVIIDTII